MTDEIVIGGDMADIPEGTYPATLAGIDTKYSEKFASEFRTWDFTLANGSKVGGSSSMATSSKSKGGKWLAAILGRKPVKDEHIALSSLVGQPCMVTVIEDDNGWPKVDAVLPPLATPAPSSVPAALSTEPEQPPQPTKIPVAAGQIPELP